MEDLPTTARDKFIASRDQTGGGKTIGDAGRRRARTRGRTNKRQVTLWRTPTKGPIGMLELVDASSPSKGASASRCSSRATGENDQFHDDASARRSSPIGRRCRADHAHVPGKHVFVFIDRYNLSRWFIRSAR